MVYLIALRLILPLSILKFPLLGALLAIALDYVDFELYRDFNHGNLEHYQEMDKILDMYYLSIEAYVTASFKNRTVKKTLFALYIYRFLGFILFTFTQNIWVLLIFPNVFEALFIFYLASKRIFKKDIIPSFKSLIPILLILFILKLIHEYFIHITTVEKWFGI